MCVNYKPVDAALLESLTDLSPLRLARWKNEVWQDYPAPMLRAGSNGLTELALGTYGMIPRSRSPPGIRLATMNARAETINEKRSFIRQWHHAQTCLLPMAWFYEANWEDGVVQRWAIGMADGAPFCVAGLWRAWNEGPGACRLSFTQLTLNADSHAVMKHFNRPDEEKRSLVIVPKDRWSAWLNADTPEISRAMLTLYPAELMTAWRA